MTYARPTKNAGHDPHETGKRFLICKKYCKSLTSDNELYFKNASTLQRNRHLRSSSLCWSILSWELSELCRPDVCISLLLTQFVINFQGRPLANATDAVA